MSLIKSNTRSPVNNPLISNLRIPALLVLIALLAACGADQISPSGDAVSFEENSAAVVLSGSVGDGPVIGASITITDSNGEFLAFTTSDDTANYTVTVPGDAAFPVTITATGGTDVVTGMSLDFTMTSAALNTGSRTAHINPFSTLIVKTAQAMRGGLNLENMETAKKSVLQQLNFGIDSGLMPDPMTTRITEENVANIVKSSKTFAETIRRTHSALLLMGISTSEDQLIAALAADMTDGYLDGHGAAGTNPLFSTTTNVVSGQVLVEALSNNLRVNGLRATDLLDNAILVAMPTATDSTADVAITPEMIAQAKLAISAARAAAPNEALSSIAIILDNLPLTSTTISSGGNVNRPNEKLNILATQASGYDADRDRVPENVIDGNMKTKWTTLEMPQWISLDLGETQRVSKTRILFHGANRGLDFNYTVSVSTDNTNWSDVASNAVFSLSPQRTELTFRPTEARYVRISLNSSNISDYANVYEIEVYGNESENSIYSSTSALYAADIERLLPAEQSYNFEQTITSLALLSDNELEAINDRVQSAPSSREDRPLSLAWNPNADNVLGYIIYYGATPESASNIATETSATSVRLMRNTDLGLNSGDTVCFRLKAYNGHALSGFSAAACGRV